MAAAVDNPSNPFGTLLKQHRLRVGLTQEQLAERAGLSPRGLIHLEHGTRRPYPDTLLRLSEALSLTPAQRDALTDATHVAASPPASPAVSVAPPPAPPLLIGRERELGVLRERLAAARSGQGSLVLIGGEAGIGKTALAETLCYEATTQSMTVLVGRCYDLTETPPYGPWVELFASYRHADGMPPVPPAFAERGTVGEVGSEALLFRQVLDFFSALSIRCPVVLLLDDLHWADPASLDLLRFLARAAPTLPLLCLATYRSDEITRRHPLSLLLPALTRESDAERIALRPLDAEAVQALVAAQYPLSNADTARLLGFVQARAEGNALFMGELLRSLAESGTLRRGGEGEAWQLGDLRDAALPSLLRQVIDGRVARLDAESQRLLAVAAVVGQEVPLAVLGPLAEMEEEALLLAIENAATANLLVETPDGLHARFAHALIREALYEEISPARRRLLHRRIAELLAASPHPDPDAVAMHFQKAADGRAVAWLVRAGERAQMATARQTAAERYEAALALLDAADGDLNERGWLRYRIARMRRDAATAQAIEYLDEALRVAAATGDRALAAIARYNRGQCLMFQVDPNAGRELAAGCDALESLPPDELARLDLGPDEHGLSTVTNTRGGLVALIAARGSIAEAVAMGEAIRDGKPRHTPLADVAWEHYGYRDAGLSSAYALLSRPSDARAASNRMRNCFREVGNIAGGNVYVVELLLVWLPYFTDQINDLWRIAKKAAENYAREDTHYTHIANLPLLALAGRWKEAQAEAAIALLHFRKQPSFRAIANIVLSDVNRLQGDPEEAWSHLRASLPHPPEIQLGVRPWWVGFPAAHGAIRLSLDAGDLPTAKAWLDAHDRFMAASGAILGLADGHMLWAQYHWQAGEIEKAQEHAARALAHATEPRQPLALLAAHRLHGELDTEAGRHDDADAHLAASLALTDACQAPFERALTLLAMAELRAAMGKHEEAMQLLDEVRTICTPLGAKPTLARASALAARLA